MLYLLRALYQGLKDNVEGVVVALRVAGVHRVPAVLHLLHVAHVLYVPSVLREPRHLRVRVVDVLTSRAHVPPRQ